MTKIKNLKSTYSGCEADGFIKYKDEVDIDLIKSLVEMANKTLAYAKKNTKGLDRKGTDWTFVFRDYYESLRELIEAFLLFDKIYVSGHQCKNACICSNYAELELNWDFLETSRLKRNAINYKGRLINFDEWKTLKIQFDLHISALKKAIEEKISENISL